MRRIIDTPPYHREFDVRFHALRRGDVVRMNNDCALLTFGSPIKRIPVGASCSAYGTEFRLRQRIRRRWWKLWLPKYIWADFEVQSDFKESDLPF